jgi:hypothetical protein
MAGRANRRAMIRGLNWWDAQGLHLPCRRWPHVVAITKIGIAAIAIVATEITISAAD